MHVSDKVGVSIKVRDCQAFQNVWVLISDTKSRFSSWAEVEAHYNFELIPGEHYLDSTLEFKTARDYDLFVLEWWSD